MLISYLFLLMMVLLGLGFFTLLERKILGYIQLRKGPNKVSFVGLMQPMGDGLKLLLKELIFLGKGDLWMFLLWPMVGLFLCFLGWSLYLYVYDFMDYSVGIIFFFCVSSVGVYVIMYSGWGSNSSYGVIGGYRAVAQTISYEVVMALILLSVVVMVESYSLKLISGGKVMLLWSMIPMVMVWFSVLLAETNRSPYDFSEGESELVSGYNVEYSSGIFSLLFSTEYGNIMLMVYLMSLMFFQSLCLGFGFSMFLIFVIWVRGSYPRYRYDKLMSMAWKSYLSLVLGHFVLMIGIISMM